MRRSDISAKLATLLSVKGFRLPHKRVTLRALDLYASTTLDFVDTLIAAAAQNSKSKTVLSFDTDFDAIEGITRRAPGPSRNGVAWFGGPNARWLS